MIILIKGAPRFVRIIHEILFSVHSVCQIQKAMSKWMYIYEIKERLKRKPLVKHKYIAASSEVISGIFSQKKPQLIITFSKYLP